MKYFTRDLYNSIQPRGGPPSNSVLRSWRKVAKLYESYLAGIVAGLTPEIISIASNRFHDAVVKNIFISPEGQLDLSLSLAECAPRAGMISLCFATISPPVIPLGIAGDYWLYEEITVESDGIFTLNVLLSDHELSVTFDRLHIREIK